MFSDSRKAFNVGVISFGCASASLCVYSVLTYGFLWWALLIFSAFVTVTTICQIKKVFTYGQSAVYLNVYTVLVGLCGSLGLSVLFTSTQASMTLFGLGCFMYFASDIFLGLYLYRFKLPVIDAVNTALYFPGMFLVAISLIL